MALDVPAWLGPCQAKLTRAYSDVLLAGCCTPQIPLVNTWNKTARIDIALVSVKAITRRNLVFRLYTTPCYDPAFVTSAAQYTDLSFNTGNGNLANR